MSARAVWLRGDKRGFFDELGGGLKYRPTPAPLSRGCLFELEVGVLAIMFELMHAPADGFALDVGVATLDM